MKPLTITAAALAALALLAGPARAQSADADSTAPNSLRKGAMSFSLEGPFQGTNALAGIWKMVGDRTNVGLLVGLGVDTSDREQESGAEWNTDEATVSLGLAVRRYTNPVGPITPFLSGDISGYGWRAKSDSGEGDGTQKTSTRGVSLGGGLGVEWFPVRRVSLSASTGLALNWNRQHSEIDQPAGQQSESTETRFGLNTSTSGLTVQIYF